MRKGVIIVPARLKSTRLPGKLLMEVDGKSILKRTAENCMTACLKMDCHFFVACPKEERDAIEKSVHPYHHNVISMIREARNGTERCAIAFKRLTENPDFVINVQADWSMIKPEVIIELYRFMQNGCPFATVGFKDQEPSLGPMISISGWSLSRQSFLRPTEPVKAIPDGGFLRHAGIYGYHRGILDWYMQAEQTEREKESSLEQCRFEDNGIGFSLVYSSKEDCGFGIDDQESFGKYKAMVEK